MNRRPIFARGLEEDGAVVHGISMLAANARPSCGRITCFAGSEPTEGERTGLRDGFVTWRRFREGRLARSSSPRGLPLLLTARSARDDHPLFLK